MKPQDQVLLILAALISYSMLIILVVLVLIVLAAYIFIKQPQFGKAPSGEYLKGLQQSPQYKNNKFANINHTPDIVPGYSYAEVIYEFFFKQHPRRKPSGMLPVHKTDLLTLDTSKDVLVWFGHSSYLINIGGKTFLVDPVFSGNASPVGGNKAFEGTDVYTVNDLPFINYLLITHDHYDHLDYSTIIKLKNKTGRIICGLGVGAHLRHWGFDASLITELDWSQQVNLGNGFILHATPARHFSGRMFSRNNTLWLSFVLQTSQHKIYIGGDSGYDTHFAAIGTTHGPFDLAILDNGQYDVKWQYIHMLPEEVLLAAQELKAKRVLPLHNSKFAMANHSWDDPLKKITEHNRTVQQNILTPMIGEVVCIADGEQTFRQWWEGVDT